MKFKRFLSLLLVFTLAFSIGTVSEAKKVKVKKGQVGIGRCWNLADKVKFELYIPEKWWTDGVDDEEDGEDEGSSTGNVLKKITCKTSAGTFTAKSSKITIKSRKPNRIDWPQYQAHKVVIVNFVRGTTGFTGNIRKDKTWELVAWYKDDDGDWVTHKFYYTGKCG